MKQTAVVNHFMHGVGNVMLYRLAGINQTTYRHRAGLPRLGSSFDFYNIRRDVFRWHHHRMKCFASENGG